VAAAAVLAVAFLAAGGPGRVSDAWAEFKEPASPGEGTGRLSSAAGQSRYQYWSATVDQNATNPLTGTGSGTFEYWWARNGENDDTVRDAHSLYMQTLGELGIVGLALLVAFLLVAILGGGRLTLRAHAAARAPLAAAVAGCTAFALTAAVDWMWQLPVIPVAMLLLTAVAVTGDGRQGERPILGLLPRLAFGLAALVAIAAIAIPLAATTLLRESEAEARRGDLPGALEAARSAQNVQPGAATPRLQEALLLEEMGDLAGAAEAARGAAERESTNWRPWLVLSRIEARSGNAGAAVSAYRRARSLNPRSPLFDG
jgi:tetratricopeptide (TPR) repeat protein